jgi:flagellar hook assembly protein FlgD
MADYNTFLKLLIAQAKNQDPTNPTDPAQYVQQFAALSQVEQSVSTNSKLDQIIASLDSLKTTTTAT